MSEKTWRRTLKGDGTFVEGVRHSGEHVHYDNRDGSDIPVNWRDETSGRGLNLRNEPINHWAGGTDPMASKKSLGRSLGDVRKGTDEGISDIKKKRDESETRVSDLERIIEAMNDVRGGLNQESIEQMKREMDASIQDQREKFKEAAGEVKDSRETLEDRVDTLGEGIDDKEADVKDIKGLVKSLKTDFVKHHLSKLEQDSKSEAGDYKEQKKNLESTVKDVSREMKDQERRAQKVPKFRI